MSKASRDNRVDTTRRVRVLEGTYQGSGSPKKMTERTQRKAGHYHPVTWGEFFGQHGHEKHRAK